MGDIFSKNQKANTKPKIASRGNRHETTKRVRLLVLHNESQQPQENVDNLCDALNTCPPPESIQLDPGDIRIRQVPLSESVKNEVMQWIREWLNRGRIVLICFLTNCDIPLPNDNKLIMFSFRNLQVNYPRTMVVNVDFWMASAREIRAKLGELAETIMAAGNE